MLTLCLLAVLAVQQVPASATVEDASAEVASPASPQHTDVADAAFLLPLLVVGLSTFSAALSVALLFIAAGAATAMFSTIFVIEKVGNAGALGVLILPLFLVLDYSLTTCAFPLLFSMALTPVAAFLGVVVATVGVNRLSNKVAARSSSKARSEVGGADVAVGLLAAAATLITVVYPVAMVAWFVAALTFIGRSLYGGHITGAQFIFSCTFGPVLTVATWLALNTLGVLGGLLAWLSTRDATAALLAVGLRAAEQPDL